MNVDNQRPVSEPSPSGRDYKSEQGQSEIRLQGQSEVRESETGLSFKALTERVLRV